MQPIFFASNPPPRGIPAILQGVGNLVGCRCQSGIFCGAGHAGGVGIHCDEPGKKMAGVAKPLFGAWLIEFGEDGTEITCVLQALLLELGGKIRGQIPEKPSLPGQRRSAV